jgi:hypothetical protein
MDAESARKSLEALEAQMKTNSAHLAKDTAILSPMDEWKKAMVHDFFHRNKKYFVNK